MSEPFFYGCWPVNPDVERTVKHEFFKGGPSLRLGCTQLSCKASEQTKIVKQWCDYFTSSGDLREIYVSSRIPIRLFEAICCQTELRKFGFHWGPIKDFAPISKLSKLTHLGIGSCSVTDLSPLAGLRALQMLSIEHADRVSDYAPLGELRKLQYLHIEGDFWSSNKRAPIDSLNFLSTLKNLRGLSLDFVKVGSTDWHKPILKLTGLEQLFVPDVEADVRDALLSSLPKLKQHNLS